VAKPKCDNCEKDALYTCADPGVNPVNYCGSCLPQWLQQRADSGHFPLVESIEEKPAKKKEKITEAPKEEAPKEEEPKAE
jgi:hypothetical protein